VEAHSETLAQQDKTHAKLAKQDKTHATLEQSDKTHATLEQLTHHPHPRLSLVSHSLAMRVTPSSGHWRRDNVLASATLNQLLLAQIAKVVSIVGEVFPR
jgi:hypothetical protein